MNKVIEIARPKTKFDKDYVLKVLAKKEKHRDSVDLKKAVDLLSKKIYKDDIHFVLELIQNAEDEGADELTLYLDNDKVKVKNNGRIFSKKDVMAICSIGGGSKKNKIGFMGIGFKSVFHITDSPQVISGKYNFTIHDYLYPEPQDYFHIESFNYEPESGALFVLPLKKEYQNDLINFSERLFDVDEKILLFLSYLKKIHFIDATGNKVSEWSYERITDHALESVINTKTGHKNTWRVFRKPIKVEDHTLIEKIEEKEGIEKTTIVLAFPNPDIESINNCKSEPLYCFLPTEKPAQLPFILQADFIPNAGRNDIDKKPRWNTWLFNNLAQHAAESIVQLQDDDSYFKLFYELIPIATDYYDNELKEKFLTPFHNHLKNRNIVYCKDGNWHKVEDSTLIEPDLDKLIGIDDCKAIYEGDVFPASVSEFTDSVVDVLKYFDVSEIGINDIGRLFLNYSPLKEKTPDWFLDVYYYLAQKRQDYDRWNLPDVYEELETIPFLLSHDGTLVAPFIKNEKDRLVTYHPKEEELGILPKIFEDGELIFLQKRLSRKKGEKNIDEKRKLVRDFLVNQYGVSQFIDPHKIINDVILPKFENGVYLKYSTKKLVVLTNYIRENVKSWINKKKSARTMVDVDDLYKELGERLYLKVEWKIGRKTHNGFLHPAEAYIGGRRKSRTKIYEMFSWVDEAPFISDDYYNPYHVRGYSKVDMVRRGRNIKSIPWDEFFHKIGAWETPRVIRNEPVHIPRYSYSWEYIDKLPEEVNNYGYTISKDWIMPEFEKVVETFNCKPRKGKKLLNDFINQVKSHWTNYNKYKSSEIEWHYHSPQFRIINNSSFLYALQTTNWFSVNGNQPSKPEEYFQYSEKNKNLLPLNTQFIYDDKYKTFYRDIGVQEKPDRERIFAYLKEIKKEWKQKNFPDNYADILSDIYSYLLSDESVDEYLPKLKKYKSIFFPTKDCLWWHPSQAFWNDHSKIFKKRRIYINEYYPTKIKEYFELLGVEDNPSIDSCITAIDEIKNIKPIDYEVIKYINDIYLFLDKVIKLNDSIDESVLFQPIYISKNKVFHYPENVFFVDDPWYDKFDIDGVEVLYSIYPNQSLNNFLEKAGVHAFSNNYSIHCKYTNKSLFTNSDQESIITLGNHLKPYVQYTHPDMPELCLEIIENLKNLSIYRVDSLHLHLVNNNSNIKVDEVKNIDAFLQKEEKDFNLLLINDGNPISDFSEPISHEIFRIFWPFGYLDLKLVIKQLIECKTIEERNDIIRNFGIPDEIIDSVRENDKHVLLEGKQMEQPVGKQQKEKEEIVIQPASRTVQSEVKETVTNIEYRSYDEITHIVTIENPNGSRNKYSKSGVEKRKDIRKAVKGRKNKSATIKRRNTSALTTEAYALNIVMSFENDEGQDPIDVHNQKGVGYDIHSKDRFIEVKSFSGKKGQISFTPIEYQAGKKYRDKYYIYVVSQLTTEFERIEIEMIQNPINNIDFEVTGNRVTKNYIGQKKVYLVCKPFNDK